ncbi:MAG TPA: hypothetical protein VML96_09080 [Egibacteraceae bacterium]|nr:hypothetical protein [Egibacteraceae bacterium]
MVYSGSSPAREPLLRWRTSRPQLLRLLAGLWLFGTGDALIIGARLGNAPWTVLAEGVSLRTPLLVGAATLVIGVVVLLGWIPLRERPGLGTVLNVIVIGVAIDVMLALLPAPAGLAARWAALTAGIALVGVGSGLYLTAALGPGPRDGWMTGLHRRFGWPLSTIRLGIESGVLLGGWLLGGTVGVGTVAFAALIGPAVGASVRLAGARPLTGSAPASSAAAARIG